MLAQQIVAEVASREWGEDELFDLVRGAQPYAQLERASYDAVLRMLAEGYTTRNGVRGAYLHRDAATRSLRGRRGGKLAAVTSGGTIPDNADYTVLLEPQGQSVGTVNEDFAVESLAGDVFQLGNTSYRIMQDRSRQGAGGGCPRRRAQHPVLAGRSAGPQRRAVGRRGAPARRDRPSAGRPSRAHGSAERRRAALDRAVAWLDEHLGLNEDAARQIVDYLARSRAALGALPTQDTLVMERFFDESGGMQLVLHSPFGSRINRAWGLALRKRFCRTFNFELQAAATEDAIILSLSTSHSFPLDEVWRYLRSATAEHMLVQALLDAPLFNVRWRWNATTALALPRFTGGRKVAPQLQRMKSDDLLAAVFPDQAACLENIVGERELPSHPLVDQTLDDCLHEAMDSEGWLALLRRIEAGEVRLLSRDLPAPSPLAMEILNARPYAFLDDAPLEERRTQAVMSRRWTDPASTDDLGALDADAIAGVAEEAWPQRAQQRRSAGSAGGAGLRHARRSDARRTAGRPGSKRWPRAAAPPACATATAPISGWRWNGWTACRPPTRRRRPRRRWPFPTATAATATKTWTRDAALVEIMRARLSGFGPQPLAAIAASLALPESSATIALTQLESRRLRHARPFHARRRRTRNGASATCWRASTATPSSGCGAKSNRSNGRISCASCSTGSTCRPTRSCRDRTRCRKCWRSWKATRRPPARWESDLLALRLRDYSILWLDELCRAGKLVWTRIGAPRSAAGGPVRSTPIVLLPRRQTALWHALPAPRRPARHLAARQPGAGSAAARRRHVLRRTAARRPHAAGGAGKRARRAGVDRPGQRRQLRRHARHAAAGQQARQQRQEAPPRRRPDDGRSGTLGAGAARRR